MRVLRKRRAGLARNAVVVGLLGCLAVIPASSVLGGGADPARPVAVTWDGEGPYPDPGLGTTITYTGSHLTSRPASAAVAARAALTRDQAVASIGALAFSGHLGEGEPRLALRIVDSDSGFRDRLAWVAVFTRSQPFVSGPMTLTAEQRQRIIDETSCTFVVAVDAKTGDALSTTQECQ